MNSFNFDNWIKKHTNPDNYDSHKVVYVNRRGNCVVENVDGSISAEGETIEKACKSFEELEGAF